MVHLIPTADPDFCITYHGSVATLDLLSDAARRWVEDNLEIEPWQRLGKHRIAVEPRSMETIGIALMEAGFIEDRGLRPNPKTGPSSIKVAVTLAALLVGALSVSSCTAIRANQLREQMDAEMSACRAGDQDACERYQLILQQYQVERANEGNVGILGIPRSGILTGGSQAPLTCTTQQTLPGQSTMTCN